MHITSILSYLITLFSFIGQVLLPCSATLHMQMKCDLPFVPKGKPVLVKKCSKSQNLLHSFLSFGKTLSVASLSISYCVTKITKLFQEFKRITVWTLLCCVCFLTCASLIYKHIPILSASNTITPLMHPTMARLLEDANNIHFQYF